MGMSKIMLEHSDKMWQRAETNIKTSHLRSGRDQLRWHVRGRALAQTARTPWRCRTEKEKRDEGKT